MNEKFEIMSMKNGIVLGDGHHDLFTKLDQIAADIDYIAMMCDIEMEADDDE